jgi:hypothetical protein
MKKQLELVFSSFQTSTVLQRGLSAEDWQGVNKSFVDRGVPAFEIAVAKGYNEVARN